ncbi:hypothetical protein LIER_29733 [Lithospermum erythrorhizon]|uniref:Aminotransferase-like plant mobile domain-containing protein n=1 Tax=Lithospermum erythrorhizon TaxID=34254 RepID=A0AAV3RKK0_LITER
MARLAPPVLACIYRSLSQISLSDNPSIAQECFHVHYLVGWMWAYLDAQNTSTNKLDGPLMVRYHGKGKGKVYSLSDARSELHLCELGYTPVIPGLSSNTRVVINSGACVSYLERHKQSHFQEESSCRYTLFYFGFQVIWIFQEEALLKQTVPQKTGMRNMPEVVEIYSSTSEQEHTQLIDTLESPEYFTTEVVESCPPVLPTLTLFQEAEGILRAGASSLWSCICTRLEGRLPEIRLFTSPAREAVTTSTTASQNSTSEASSKLSLLMVSSEDLALKQQREVQKAEELEQEVAELEAPARDLRVRAQEQSPLLLGLILRQLILTESPKDSYFRGGDPSRVSQASGIFDYRSRSF